MAIIGQNHSVQNVNSGNTKIVKNQRVEYFLKSLKTWQELHTDCVHFGV